MGRSFLGCRFYINSVSRYGIEKTITGYLKNQGKEKKFEVLHKDGQMRLFWKYNNAPWACSGAYFFPKIQKPKKSLLQMGVQVLNLQEPGTRRKQNWISL